MAGFQEVMRQWRRFCKSNNHCGECEFDGKGICGDFHLTKVPFADIELRIMAWAAEHPEPVYPTWIEWLVDIGVIGEYAKLPLEASSTVVVSTTLAEPIPADIAQKLGIEPKEG